MAAGGFIVGRTITLLFIEHVQMRSGVRAAIRTPFTHVPFWLSRSQICAAPAVRMLRAWLRDTAASWRWSTTVSPRPTTTCPVLGSGKLDLQRLKGLAQEAVNGRGGKE